MEQPAVSLEQVAKWLGELQINMKLAQEQIELLSQENARLNALLSTCKCEREDAEKT